MSGKFVSLLLVYTVCLFLFSTQVARCDTWVLLFAFGGIFTLYGVFLRQKHSLTMLQLLLAAAVVRLAVSTGLPWLSDDFYRFLWDGRLLLEHQIHPFAYTPEQTPIRDELYNHLNSQRFFTVYPVICQLVFFLGAFGKFPFTAIIIMRALLLIGELGTIYLIARRVGTQKAIWYAFNPLVVIEICGNLHFEGLAIFFLVAMASVLTKSQTKPIRAAVWWALAIATKITPALLAPLLFAWLRGRARWMFTSVAFVAVLLLFLPIGYEPQHLINLRSSLSLYFQHFQINASIFYIFKALESWVKGKYSIALTASLLSLSTVLMVFWLAWRLFREHTPSIGSLFNAITWAFLVHLLLSSAVHPWYVLVPFSMAFFAADRRLLPFVTAWTGLIFLSYSHYFQEVYQERYAFLVVEYALLGGVWVWLSRKNNELTQ
jgi:alpha-1,6-mannosyltransferase